MKTRFSVYQFGTLLSLLVALTTAFQAEATYVKLAIFKSDGVTTVVSNQTITYQIVVTNYGTLNSPGSPVVDTFPAGLANISWTTTGTGGGTAAVASGTGHINTTVSLPTNASVTFTATAKVVGSGSSCLISNYATIAAPSGLIDQNLADNSASDVDQILTTASALTSLALAPGATATFTTVASGPGPFTYQWTRNGVNLGGATSSSYSIPSVVASNAATYCVIVSGPCSSVTNCASLSVLTPASIKQLYLSADGSGSPDQDLDRVDPVASGDASTAQTASLGGGDGTVALDRVSTGTSITSSLTISHITTSAANRLMLVGVSLNRLTPTSYENVTSVTYGGQSLTLVGAQTNATTGEALVYIWALKNPTAGTADVVLTCDAAATDGFHAGVATFSGVNQTTPYGSFYSHTGGTTPATLTLPSASGELVFDTVMLRSVDFGATDSPLAGQTALWKNFFNSRVGAGGSIKAGAASITMSWSESAAADWAIGAISIKPATAGTDGAVFAQTPALCENLVLASGNTVGAEIYFSTASGTMPASPNISATLKHGSTVIATSTGANTNAGGKITFSFAPLASNVTIPSGQAITLALTNQQSGVTFRINYDSATAPSKITLPTTTVIHVDALGVYTAAYPGGSLVTTQWANSTLYVRATVGDPFGAYDITSLPLSIDGPGVIGDFSTVLTDANVVANNGCAKTYEYVWSAGTNAGTYTLIATGKEGLENSIISQRTNTITLNCSNAAATSLASLTLCAGQTASFSTVASGTGPFSFQWSKNGANLSGATNSSFTIGSVVLGDAATYCVKVSGNCGSVTNCATLTVKTNTSATAPTSVQVIVGQSASFSTVASGTGPFTYQWSKNGTNISGATGSTYSIPSVVTSNAGTYCVLVSGSCNSVTNCATLTFNPSAALGDFVWNDLNYNGRQDAGEPGLSNVLVKLTDCAGAVLRTTNTAANGFYLFPNLAAGSYKVLFTAPSGYVFTTADVGTDDKDSDANPASGLTPCYTLAAGETNLTVDAGLYVYSCVPFYSVRRADGDAAYGGSGNHAVYLPGIGTDFDFIPTAGSFVEAADGTAQMTGLVRSQSNTNNAFAVSVTLSGRTTIPGVDSPKKELSAGTYSENGGPVVTANWYYYTNFTGTLAGLSNYAGATLTLGRVGPAFQVGFGANGKNINFGASSWFNWTVVQQPTSGTLTATGQGDFNLDLRSECATGAVGDFVWYDTNSNGRQDAGEPGRSNVTVNLMNCAGTILATTNTDANGLYFFGNLLPGIYKIGFTAPSGYNFSPSNATTDDKDSDANVVTGQTVCFTLNAAETNLTLDAGLIIPPAGECPDGPVAMLGAGGSVTLINARYDYPSAGQSTWYYCVTGASSGNAFSHVVFQMLCPSILIQGAGTWNGSNQDALTSGGGNPQPGSFPATPQTDPTTDVLGLKFDSSVPNNTTRYFYFTVNSNYVKSAVTVAAKPGNLIVMAMVCGPANDCSPEKQKAALGDFVWRDNNTNGLQDAGEPGVSNVLVQLLNCSGAVLATTNTDVTGRYLFANLMPGSYKVIFTAPSGATFTTANLLPDDRDSDADPGTGLTACYTLVSGETNRTVDAGLVFCTNTSATVPGSPSLCVGQTASFSTVASGTGPFSYQWAKNGANLSGATNSAYSIASVVLGDAGSYCVRVSGACGSVTNCAALTVKTSTSATGPTNVSVTVGQSASFSTVASGTGPFTYQWSKNGANIGGATNASYSIGSVTVGDVGTYCVKVSGNCNSVTNCATLTVGALAALGDFVWFDRNANGIQDGGTETGVPNVTVRLLSNNVILASQLTDVNGGYLFANLLPGTYGVLFTNLPSGYSFSPPNQGGNDATDSDANIVTGLTPVVLLALGETNRTLDAGLFTPPLCVTNCVPLSPCTPPYPFASTNARTSIAFTESEVLRGFTVSVTNGCTPKQIRVYYNDEHALTLGVRRVIVKTAAGTTTNDYPISALNGNPGGIINPLVGSTVLSGDQAGTDVSDRPLYPALFITDITLDPTSLAGDWQFGGTAISPHAVFGTWKGAVRTVDKTRNPAVATVTPDADPAKNQWNLGTGDPVPPGLVNQGFGAEVRWETDQLGLLPGHTYRLYFMVHDGDQNKTGGDSGQGCVTLNMGQQVDCGTNSLGAIGDFVWRDLNTNGLQDAGEPGVSNVIVRLTDCAGTTLRTTTTDVSGHYVFGGLGAGSYRVGFTAPAGLTFTTPNQSPDDRDSDAEIATGLTACYVLAAGQTNLTLDAGLVSGCQPSVVVSVECQDAAGPGQPITFTGWIANSGEGAVTNVTLSHSVSGLVKFFGTLAPGVTTNFSGSYIPTGCGDFTSSITLVGRDACSGAAITIPEFFSCSVPCPSACLGDYVWEDLNRDGLQNDGDTGLSNVTVQLFTCGGTNILQSTVTSSNGFYLFCGLTPGSYQVRVLTPNGYVVTTQNASTNDCVDSDADATGLTDCVTVISGETNVCTDIGLYRPAALGDFVWLDRNANGIQDGGTETGVPNVTVLLLSNNVVINSQLTDANGGYLFANLLPGTYGVLFTNLPNGYFFSPPDQGGNDTTDSDANVVTGLTPTVTLASGETNRTLDAGIYQTACLGDYVWDDLNRDGVQNDGNTGMSNLVVQLFACAGTNALQTTLTSSNGFYLFCNLTPGSYQVRVAVPQGYTVTLPNSSTNQCADSDADANGLTACVTLTSGETNLCTDIGLIDPVALGDFVWFDRNANGLQDIGEPGVSNVTVLLLSNNVVLASQMTDLNGGYLFTNLLPGTYGVLFTNLPGGFVFSPANQGTNDAADSDANILTGRTPTVTLGLSETNLTLDAGVYQTACVGDYVWEDLNRDGVQNDGNTGLSNVTVQLFACNGTNVLQTTLTSSNGFYLFCGLAPGSYQVRVLTPNGYVVTTQNASTNDCVDSDALANGLTECVTVTSGETNTCTDIGFYRPAALGDFVWFDRNANGLQDGGTETGVPNVTVLLLSNNVVISSQLTDANGGYLFTGLIPGTYGVLFTNLPAGYVFSPANQGGNDTNDSDANILTGRTPTVTLASGQTNLTLDAGIYQTACVGDYVWEDLNRDGLQNDGNTGLSNVTVQLFACNGTNLLQSTVTSSNGFYLFCNLVPGSYQIRALVPNGYTVATQNASTNDCVDSDALANGLTGCITVTSGETNLCTDIGLYRPAALGDFVWRDTNTNGLQDAGEPGVSNVLVQLMDCSGALLNSTNTDVNGRYLFANLLPGGYKITFTAPSGTTFTIANQVPDDRDSDANQTNGMTACYTLVSGETNLTADAGLVFCIPATATGPNGLTVCPGLPASFSTVASGTGPFTYQWTKSGTNISGATNSSYSIASVVSGDAGTYCVKVTGNCGSVTNCATFTVKTNTTATTPASQSVCPGLPVTFSTAASGTGPFSYQWTRSGTNIVGATNSSYSLASVVATNAGTYCVIVSGDCNSVTNCAMLTVKTNTTATSPTNELLCPGGSATFSTVASGTGPFAYQWTKNGTNISGATNSSYSIASVFAINAGTYCVVVSGSCNSVTNCATLTVKTNTTATTPFDQQACLGQTATFSTVASGSGPFSYQWTKNGVNILGATNSLFSIASVVPSNTGAYCVIVSGDCNIVTNCATLQLSLPGLAVTKSCPANPVMPGAALVFSGSVSNSGNIILSNIIVLNSQPTNGTPVFSANLLVPGQVLTFSNSYLTVAGDCGPYTDTLTASATSVCGEISAFATATCAATNTASIKVIKYCPQYPVAPGGLLLYSGSISNSGNITLTNVLVFNDQPTNGTLELGPLSLSPGQIIYFTCNGYYVPTNACGPWIDTLTVTATSLCGSNVTDSSTAYCPAVTAPSLAVAKLCPENPVAPGGVLNFSGFVTNTGDITLTNVVVVNSQPTNGTIVFTTTNLAPGEWRAFGGSYTTPANDCGPVSDTLTATATSICGSNVTATVTAACPTITTPGLVVQKFCPTAPVAPGNLITITGSISNSGNVILTNVVVVDNHEINSDPVLGPITLAPSQTLLFTNTYRVPADACGPWTDTLAATGRSLCGSNVTASASASCPAVTTPSIVVTKYCPANPVAPGGQFTYTGSVSNSGNITLTNIIVVNDLPTNGTVVFTLNNLAPGQIYYFTCDGYTVPTNSCGPWIDTLTVTATSICGTNVTDSDTATCPALTSPSMSVAKFCPANPVVPGAVLTFTGYVTNSGDITLTNVVVVNSQPTNGTPVFTITNLAPGEWRAFTNSYHTPSTQCGPWSDTLTASATSLCGSNVSATATATCAATTAPSIRVAKFCPANPVAPGGLLVFTGSVSNSGNITLTNVVVLNSQPTNGTPVFALPILLPGQVNFFTNSYTVPLDACGPWVDTLTATATSRCGSNVTDSATATCSAVTAPAIRVTKTCATDPIAPGGSLIFIGSVSNSGNITVTNVVVLNSQPTNGTPVFALTNLAPGQVRFFTNSYTVALDACGPWSDTLTATATSKCGSNVTHSATASCTALTTPSIRVTKSCPANPVAPGGLLIFTGSVSNSGNISLTNVVVLNSQPTNGTPVFTMTNLAPGQVRFFTNSYIVAADACGPWSDTLTATATSKCGSNVTHSATANCTAVTAPSIRVAKFCPANPVAPGGVLVFTGSVSNSGNISLTNIVVLNNQPTNGTPVFALTNLAPGQVRFFTNSYTVASDACGPWSDTLTVTARSICGSNVTDSASATCTAFTTPALRVTKFCPANPVAPGGLLVFTGSVSNSGNITLTNLIVVNSQPTNGTPVFGPATLAPGAVAVFTNSYTVSLDSCGPWVDTLTATATSICGSNVTHSATANCTATTAPAIRVAKFCPANPVAPGGLLVFTGSVSNSGNITLTNVVVLNNQPTNGTPVFTATNLAPGQVFSFTNSYTVGLDSCGPWTDTLTVTAKSLCGSNVTDSATATCTAVTAPSIRVAKFCPANPVAPGGVLVFTGSVSNSGNISLTNIVVLNNQPTNGTPVFSITTLAPGQVRVFTNSYTVALDACGPWSDTLTATATSICGSNVTHSATATCAAITAPSVRVAKFCPANPVAPGGVLVFTGSVSNSGNITLTNVVVVNSQPTNGTPVFTATNLAPGQAFSFTNSYTVPLDACGPWVDTLTATATSICGSNVTHSATATCTAITAPAIRVTKSCPANPVAPGGLLVFSGSVSNAGNITLTNIVVVNDQPTNGTPVFTTTNLAPGQVMLFTNAYIVPADQCGPWVDTLTATATSLCGSNVMHNATATCAVTPSAAALRVTKNCPENPVAPGGLLVFTGSVSNSGNVTLTNVIVLNSQPTNGTPVFGPVTLVPGEVRNFSGSYNVALDSCGPWSDTLTATARSICGTNVSHTATATCAATNFPEILLIKNCPAIPVAPGGLFVFTGSVSNCGNVTLTNIVVLNNQPAPGTTVFTLSNLAPGQTRSFTNSYTVPLNDCGPWLDTLTVTARTICGSNITGSATASCPAQTTPSFVLVKACPANPVGPGELFIFTGSVSNNGNVTLTNVVVLNSQPTNGTPVVVVTNLAPGQSITFTNSYNVGLDSCGPWSDTLTATAKSICGQTVTRTATANCPALTTASIRVAKFCPANPVMSGGLLVITGSVSNSGNITLTNVIVVNDQPAPGTVVFTITNLAPGQVRTFTNSYTVPANDCGPWVDTLTATAKSLCGSNVTHSATATCASTTAASIRVTKSCPVNPVAPGGLLIFTGSVSNSGNVTLTNVIVLNDQPTNGTPVFGPATLLPGQVFTFTNSYTVATNQCGPWTDTLTATARSVCGSNVTHSATANCPATTTAALRVTKFCPANPVAPGGVLVFTGSVSNSGNITLTNVLVVNSQPTNGTPVLGPVTLLPGQSLTFSNSYTTPTNDCGPWVDTLTATAKSICGTNASHTATATCASETTPSISVTKNCPANPVAPGALLIFTGSVSNSGNITLTNIVVRNDRPTNGTPVFTTTNLAPGQVRFFTNSYRTPTNDCGPWVDTLTATATSVCGTNVTDSDTAVCETDTTPVLTLTKDCPLNPVAPGGLLVFTGSIRNSGGLTVDGIVVRNNRPVLNTYILGPISLVPGEIRYFTNSYTVPLNDCGPWDDTLTASGTSICGSKATATASAFCPAVTTPSIRVTKSCPANPVAPGGLFVFTGSVSNSGNISLTNIVVVNDQPSNGTPVFATTNLAPGQVLLFTNSYLVPTNSAGPWIDTLTATATSICGTEASHTATATCPALLAKSALGDFVWRDLNANGLQDAGEPGISNVLVQLMDCGGALLNSTNTDGNGRYLFANLAPGSYKVTFTAPSGLTFTTANQLPDDRDSDANPANGMTACYTLASGETNLTVDAGLYQTACLGDYVWEDLNRDGLQNDGSTGLSNVTVQLFACEGTNVLQTTLTSSNGFYLFCGLTPGSYQVRVLTPNGYIVTTRNASTNDCVDSDALASGLTDCVTLTSGETNLCTDIGLYRPAALGDFVWFDRNANGIQDGGSETGVSNVTVLLLSNNVVINSQLTDLNGGYLFTGLIPGTYGVLFTNLPAGYVFSPANQGGNDTNDSDANILTGRTPTVTLASDQTNLTLDAGIYQTACLGDYVWEDLNRDGVQNDGNTGLSNVTMQLFTCGGTNVLQSTVTSSNGFYLFCGLTPGSYQVRALVPNGYTVTTRNASTNDCVDSDALANGLTDCVTLSSGETNLCTDIGLYRPAALGDFVWRDNNTNGLQDLGEPGVSNVLVQLMDCSGTLLNSTNTDATGHYLFANLVPGSYRITFTAPAGTTFTMANQLPDDRDSDANQTNGLTACYTLVSGETNLTVDAGLVFCIPATATGPNGLSVCPGQPASFSTVASGTGPFTYQWTKGGVNISGATNSSYTLASVVSGDAGIYCVKVTGNCGSVTNCATLTVSTPALRVTKSCPLSPVAPGGLLIFTGSVSNSGDITLTNVLVVNSQPTNGFVVFTATNLAPGQVFAFTNSHTVPTNACGPWSDTLTATARSVCGLAVTNTATANCPALIVPGLEVVKNCPPAPVAPGALLLYTGAVRNTGNVPITNVVVINNMPVPNTVVFTAALLAPGQKLLFTNSYTTPVGQCGPWNDLLTATARTICGEGVTNSVESSCPATGAPRIVVTKSCPLAPVGPGELLVFSGTVSNAGDLTLQNIVVVNNRPTNSTPVFALASLAPGEVRGFTNSYRTPTNDCGPWVDTLTATAISQCGSNVTGSATATCTAVTTPRLSLTKRCPTQPTPYGGFLIYSGVVSNSGNITLTNVYVVDDKPTNNTPVIGPITLAPGAWAAFTNGYAVPTEICCGAIIHDTLTARGTDKCTGSNVTKTATAVCPLVTAPGLLVTRTCPTGPVTPGQPISYSGILTNTGNVTLSNVLLIADSGVVLMGLDGLAKGEWMDYTDTFTVANCNGPVTNTLTLTGYDIRTGVRVTSTAVCVVNCNGQPAPLVMNPVMLQHSFGITFNTEAGHAYEVEYVNSFTPPVLWKHFTNVIGDGGPAAILDGMTNQMRYFRVKY